MADCVVCSFTAAALKLWSLALKRKASSCLKVKFMAAECTPTIRQEKKEYRAAPISRLFCGTATLILRACFTSHHA
ncbi:Uncharacterised protein [Mycobacterium tuberculosis]|nr:Uncharacterised protein [Mycobacterium tuberculosis]